MKAAITNLNGSVSFTDDYPDLPRPGHGQVLVRVKAAAQNTLPDWIKHHNIPTQGIVAGDDFAGVVEAIGDDLPSGTRRVGDRVAGFINGSMTKEEGGTYADYCLADSKLVISLPDAVSFEEGAALPLSTFTACQMLWQALSLADTPLSPRKQENSETILVWGGASAVGMQTIQLAKLSGFRIVTTASPPNHELLRSLGAEQVFDYRDPDVVSLIREATGSSLRYVVDCVSTKETMKLIGQCLSGEGIVGAVLDEKVDGRDDVKCSFKFVYTLLGKEMQLPYPKPVVPGDYETAVEWAGMISQLLRESKLKSPPVFRAPGGLRDVQKWLEYQHDGKLGGKKVVYVIDDTQ